MLKTYIGPHSPARVVVGGEDFGFVEYGESIAVDDELANSVAWPEEHWQDGVPTKEEEKSDAERDNSNEGVDN